MFEVNPVTFPDPVATSCSVSGFKRLHCVISYIRTLQAYISSIIQCRSAASHRGELRDAAVCTAGAQTEPGRDQSLKAGSDAADSALGDWMDSVKAGY